MKRRPNFWRPSCLIVICGCSALQMEADPLDELTLRPSPLSDTPSTVRTIVFGDGSFVAGADGMILASSNGVHWDVVLHHTPEMPVSEQRGLAFGGGRFVSVSANNDIWTSTNAIQWIRGTNVFTERATNAVAYGNGRFVAVGSGRPSYSSDGVTFSRALIFPNSVNLADVNFLDIAYGDGVFVAVGTLLTIEGDAGSTLIMTSPSGFSWTLQTNVFPATLNGDLATRSLIHHVAYGRGRFVAIGTIMTNLLISYPPIPIASREVVLTSLNGIDWVADAESPLKHSWPPGSLSFHNGMFVFPTSEYSQEDARQKGVLYISTNGSDWEKRWINTTLPCPGCPGGFTFLAFQHVAFGHGTFVLAGGEYIAQSQPVVQLRQREPGLLSLIGLRDRTYAIEATEDLALQISQWQTIATMTLPNQPTIWRDSVTNLPARFYRAVWIP